MRPRATGASQLVPPNRPRRRNQPSAERVCALNLAALARMAPPDLRERLGDGFLTDRLVTTKSIQLQGTGQYHPKG